MEVSQTCPKLPALGKKRLTSITVSRSKGLVRNQAWIDRLTRVRCYRKLKGVIDGGIVPKALFVNHDSRIIPDVPGRKAYIQTLKRTVLYSTLPHTSSFHTHQLRLLVLFFARRVLSFELNGQSAKTPSRFAEYVELPTVDVTNLT